MCFMIIFLRITFFIFFILRYRIKLMIQSQSTYQYYFLILKILYFTLTFTTVKYTQLAVLAKDFLQTFFANLNRFGQK